MQDAGKLSKRKAKSRTLVPFEVVAPNVHAKPGFNRGGIVKFRDANGDSICVKEFYVALLGILTISNTTDEAVLGCDQYEHVFFEQRIDMPRYRPKIESGSWHYFQLWFPDQLMAPRHLPAEAERLCEIPPRRDLPPSGDFGHGVSVKYIYKAVLVGEERHITARLDMFLSPTRTIEIAELRMIDMVRSKSIEFESQAGSAQKLTLALRCPIAAILGDQFPVWIRLVNTSNGPTQVCLESCSIVVRTRTSAQNGDDARKTYFDQDTINRQSFSENEWPTMSTQALDLRTIFHDLVIPGTYLPTFLSYYLSRQYTLEILVSVVVNPDDIGNLQSLQTFEFVLDAIAFLPAESSLDAWNREAESHDGN